MLSAVDTHVGRSIFENCIMGFLKDKTRVFVTHQLQYAKYANRIVVMDDGKILEQGTFDELANLENGQMKKLMEEYNLNKHEEEEEKKEEEIKPVAKAQPEAVQKTEESKKAAGKLMQDEERGKGSFAISIIFKYTWMVH